MVQSASSSKSNLSSRSKSSIHSSFKVGPPTKKPDAVSMAKSKNTKQQSIKKYGRKDENAKPLEKESKTENIHAQYAAQLKKLKAENDALRKASTAQPVGLARIPRPEKGVAGRGFNLRTAMGLEEDPTLYCTVRRCIRNLADRAGLDCAIAWHSQPKETVGKIIGAARERHKFLNQFPHGWPVEEFLKTYLKNKRAYARKRGYLIENTNQMQAQLDDEEEDEEGDGDDDDKEEGEGDDDDKEEEDGHMHVNDEEEDGDDDDE